MFSEENPNRLAQVALVALLIVGCVAVLLPIIGAVLFALVLWISTWAFYAEKILPRLGGRKSLGAALMTVALILLMLVPMIFLVASLANSADTLVEGIRPYIDRGLPAKAPALLSGVPLIGSEIEDSWHRIASSRSELNGLLKQLIEPARTLALATGKVAANGVLQLALVLFVIFFLYRDGELIAKSLYIGARKLGGDLGEEMVERARGTVNGVMVGIVGTAVAQATVAMIGFLIAGVPGAVLLGFATFFLSMIPIGPPLLWGGAAAWLYAQGEMGWAIFMVLYGLLVISSVDNLVKPILIARGSGISILLIALGMIGGILVFGFIGIFLGPVLLALGHMLLTRWTREDEPA
ncbi:MAG: AI-2E family transporter [Burkholderiaceae bacterium]|nr:AI-2E family transporter [Burkholderiaceae bacterium]